ncbi:WW domain-containing protein [Favolaschia claudopus]|uniref:WW domain-containing protein n=1 Tax=Favolaschia claudopus TaxID=2862362 RepID=A0AAW0CV18_9AGAR
MSSRTSTSTPTEEKEKTEEPSPTPEASSSKVDELPTSGDAPESTGGTDSEAAPADEPPPMAWQAVFSPQFNAYYFYNSITQETTWTNPLVPPETTIPEAASSSTPEVDLHAQPDVAGETSSIPHYAALQTAAIAQGIDPSLAYLDPSLAASSSAANPSGVPPSFQAKFNARTGQFAAMDSRSPAHLSEYERAKRMSEVFFDVAAWEQNLAESHAAEAEGGVEKKRKRPTKKDLERFKQQKKLKKIAKTAWLRM